MSAAAPPENPLQSIQVVVEPALEAACADRAGCPTRLAEAMRYSLLAPGKRLRPALVLWASEALGGKMADAMPAAVAVEMIHAYSLVHDDLPAMDDDDLRRGRPTTHIVYDEATAILVGDALQARAFEVLATELPSRRAVLACAELARAAGPAALVGGQADDLAAETSGDHTLAQLEAIHRRKTAALLIASLRLGGICADADADELERLGEYGMALGLAFQIVDDLLDATATTDVTGKRTGKDEARGKLTYPLLMGVEASRERATELLHQAKRLAALWGPRGGRLTWMAQYVMERGGIRNA